MTAPFEELAALDKLVHEPAWVKWFEGKVPHTSAKLTRTALRPSGNTGSASTG